MRKPEHASKKSIHKDKSLTVYKEMMYCTKQIKYESLAINRIAIQNATTSPFGNCGQVIGKDEISYKNMNDSCIFAIEL